MNFSDSYLGKLRKIVGSRLVLVPGARIVVHDRLERVLLELRSDFRRWGLPGGHQEVGDSSADTAIREVFEETGLRVKRPQVFGIASDPRHETIRFPNGDRTQTVSVMFHASKPRGEPKFDPRETLELGWFALDDLPTDLMPNSVRTLKAFRRYRATGQFQMI
jgi:8-oxo-dGTP pyrophosphatase MutT (NUDIX family)